MTILLIDDNISTLATLKQELDWKTIGIDEVLTAESADEAEAVLERKNADIIVCDIEMPIRDGLSFMKDMRKKGISSVCIFLTAHAEFDYARRAIEVNSMDYILKPFSIKEVSQKFADAVFYVKKQNENSSYIRYGKLWMNGRNNFSPSEKKELLKSEKEATHKGVEDAKLFIRDHYAETITLQDIADYAHHNPSYLSTIFHQQEGVTPLDYLASVRISQARLLLSNPSFNVSDVAMMVGFNNIPYFNKVFKNAVGMTPTAYRKSLADRQ